MKEGKSFNISQKQILAAYKLVKVNKGAGGVDGIEFEAYEKYLKNNLYKLWNRMSSGSYFPKSVKGVEIPKKNGKMRLLGIPTIEDRVAQMVVKMVLEPLVEPIFYEDSYGYRPNKSALDAVGKTRERCWKYPWLLEFDIVGLFDNINHEKMMSAVKMHTQEKWIILYVERFLKAPMKMPNGEIKKRLTGTPQGGVISPVLANLFLHYAFDKWISKNFNTISWERFADDAVVHCKNQIEANLILSQLKERMNECGLELHPEKTKIVYCQSDKNNGNHENQTFDFLGYTFRKRQVKSKYGEFFNGFTPAVSKSATKSLRNKIKKERLFGNVLSLEGFAEAINPIIRGWANYFMKYSPSIAKKEIDYVNIAILLWIKKKYKKVGKSWRRAWKMLVSLAKFNPDLFYHWSLGIRPTIG